MTDEELILMYRKYKLKRIILIIILFILVILSSLIIYKFSQNDTKTLPKNSIEIKEEESDNIPPELKLKDSAIEVYQGEEIDYLSYIESAIDNKDGDLISKVKYEKIDTSIVGEQKIIYSVSDSSDNFAQKEISVIIIELPKEKPSEQKPSKEESKKETDSSKQKPSTDSNKNEKPESFDNNESSNKAEKIVKYFLFSDGYTMLNVAEACTLELKKYNKTGMCSPLQDEKGIYLGMKLEIN